MIFCVISLLVVGSNSNAKSGQGDTQHK